MAELKLCPFCGNPAGVIDDLITFHVACNNCGATGSESSYRDAAIAAWNRRTTGAVQAGAVPDGYKLVPVEATQEMCRAAVIYANGEAVYKNVNAEVLTIEEGIYAEVYEAMLSAAPSPAPVAEPVGDAMREALNQIADGRVMTPELIGTRAEYTHADTVLAYQALARRALAAPVAVAGQGTRHHPELHYTRIPAPPRPPRTPASHAPHEGAKPVAPTDMQINELRSKYGVTSDGRGIKEWTKVLDFARAVLALAAPQEHEARDAARWRPIETAPKDVHILLGRIDDEGYGYVQEGCWQKGWPDAPDDMGCDDGFVSLDFDMFRPGRSFGAESYRHGGTQPTHWQPLPSAPDAARAVKGDRT